MQETLKLFAPIIAAHAVVLVLVILIIKRLLLGDTMRAVQRIQQVEGEVRKKEEGIRAEIEKHEKEFAALKAEAEMESQRQREAAAREAEALKEQTVAEARREGDRIIAQARKNEKSFRDQLAMEAQEQAVEFGGEVFKLVFSEQVTEALNARFVDELLDALQELDAATVTADASDAEIRASHPLQDAQRARLEKLLAEKFDARVKVEEKIDPSLLAGIVFKLGSLEIDGSLASRYREAVDEVKKISHGAAA